MAGADNAINAYIGDDLKKLMDYLDDLESRTGKKYILYNYGTKEDGTPDTSNIICVTLLINIFQLQMLKDRNKYRFPTLVRMWQRFVFDCKDFIVFLRLLSLPSPPITNQTSRAITTGTASNGATTSGAIWNASADTFWNTAIFLIPYAKPATTAA